MAFRSRKCQTRPLGTVLSARIAQLARAGARVSAKLSRLNHGSVDGLIAEIAGRRSVAIVAKRTTAKLGAVVGVLCGVATSVLFSMPVIFFATAVVASFLCAVLNARHRLQAGRSSGMA